MTNRCSKCNTVTEKWSSRCPKCGEWNTIVSTGEQEPVKKTAKPISISDIDQKGDARIKSGIQRIDSVLGGGIVPGSVILLSGEPGIGKSTLLAQVLHSMALTLKKKALYVTGEESLAQIALRAHRIKAIHKDLMMLDETDVDVIVGQTKKMKPAILAVDSIQTVLDREIGSESGSVMQIRRCAARLISYAKKSGVPVVLVGHVTKDGSIAGPKILEHMVDTVLEFRGVEGGAGRSLHVIKNRFGPGHVVEEFEMRGDGLG